MDEINDSPLARVGRMFGVAGDGISFQTTRAAREQGVIPTRTPVEPSTTPATFAPVEQTTTAPLGGPSPSSDLLARVRARQEAEQAESLRRLLADRQTAPQPAVDRPLAGGIYR